MENITDEDRKDALRAISSMIGKTEKAKEKFQQGTAPHTLESNRLEALLIASSLISNELDGSPCAGCNTQEELKKALAPIASLISKSEKALTKLAHGTWQHTMLSDYLKALNIASQLLGKALNEANAGQT